jgi:hypothetical protein
MKPVSLVLGLVFAMCAASAAQTVRTKEPSKDFGACIAGNNVIIANQCPGGTLGLKVNAADAVLGSNPGEIWVYGGGAWGDEKSRSTISSNHILRLFAGTYTSTSNFGYILLKDSSALICQDPANTILYQPTRPATPQIDVWSIVKAFGQSSNPQLFVPNQNISVKGCRFRGGRAGFHAGQAVVEMGNCHHCEVSGNVFENLVTIAVAYGSPASYGSDPLALGKYAEGSSVHHNTFISSNAVNVAMTNGQNISINDNIFLRPGIKNGSYPIAIDIEPNVATDRALNISVLNNQIDFHDAAMLGDGVTISNYPGVAETYFGQIVISGNTFRGGLDVTAPTARRLRTALLIKPGVRDVTFSNNVIRFARNSGIYVNGTNIHVEGNSIVGTFDPAAGYYPILLDTESNNSTAVRNLIYCSRNPAQPCANSIRNNGAASNVVSDNVFALMGQGGPAKPRSPGLN